MTECEGWDRWRTGLGDELAAQQTENTDAQNKANKTHKLFHRSLITIYNLISEQPQWRESE